jgi:hypothetical protein
MNNIDVKHCETMKDFLGYRSHSVIIWRCLHNFTHLGVSRSFESFESFESSTLFGGNKTGWKAPRVQSASTMVLCQAGNASANGIGYGNCGSVFLNLDNSGFSSQLETWKLTFMNLYSNFYEMSGGLWSLWWHRHVGSMHFLSRFKCCEHPPIRQIISNNVQSISKPNHFHVRSKPRKPCCRRFHRLPHCSP